MPEKGLNFGRNLASSLIASVLLLGMTANSLGVVAKPETSTEVDLKVAAKSMAEAKAAAASSTKRTINALEAIDSGTPLEVAPGDSKPYSTIDPAPRNAADADKSSSSDITQTSAPGATAEATKTEGTNQEETVSQSAEATEETTAQSKEQLLKAAAQHWELSKRYFGRGDLDMCETELDLAILNCNDLQIAHRDLCILSLFRFNLPRAAAEFMVTTGICEPIPLTASEAQALIKSAMIKHYKKGLAYARKKDWTEVAWELQLAAHLAPNDYAVQHSLAFAYANLGDFNRAVEHYKTTFELAPNDGSSRADLAYFLAENGKTEEAFKQMEEAVETTPQAACYHVDLSWMAQARGDLETATKEMKTAVDLAPKQAGLWAHLGEVLEKKGDSTEAVDAYNHALGLDPMLTMAKERLSKLQEHHS